MGRRQGRVPQTNTFRWLCWEFQRSAKWVTAPENGGYEPATKNLWARELDFACRHDILGNATLDEIRPALIQGYLDGWADKPGKQQAALAAFKQLERWASVRDFLHRPLTLGVKTGRPTGGHEPWSHEQVGIGERYARSDLARVITLGANTGQRGSDLIRMGFNDIKEVGGRQGIELAQVKTGRRLWIPINDNLGTALAAWERRPGPFLLNQWGERWTRQQLTNAWNYERDTNPNLKPLAGLVLHGLRAHKCVELFRAGLNPKQIASLVGMSTPMVERYTRLADQQQDALAAIYQLENFRGTKLRKVESSD